MESMKRELELQRYFDGEMTPEERARFEAELTSEERQSLDALGEMRGLLRDALHAQAEGVNLWQGIEGEIQKGRPADDLAKARAKRRGLGTRMLGLATAVAAAAAFVFIFQSSRITPSNECDIENFEVEGAFATVLKLADTQHGGDATTTVVWAQED